MYKCKYPQASHIHAKPLACMYYYCIKPCSVYIWYNPISIEVLKTHAIVFCVDLCKVEGMIGSHCLTVEL